MVNRAKQGFNLISLLDQDSINSVNSYLNTKGSGMTYSRRGVAGNIRIFRALKNFSFYDKLMRQKPGFTRKEEDENEKT